jgi:hypothetical protein
MPSNWFLGDGIKQNDLVPSSTVAFHMADKWVRYDDEGNEAWDHLIPGIFHLAAATSFMVQICLRSI